MTAVSFVLGISLGEISKVQMIHADVPALDDAFTWFVRAGTDEVVTIHALYNGRVIEIGRATWSSLTGKLVDRTSINPKFPNAYQWNLVATALNRVRRRAIAKLPAWRRAIAMIDPSTRPILLGAVIVGLLAVGGIIAIFLVRSKSPPRASLGPYDNLVWSDVEAGGETTVPLILKDAERERGRKLCVAGTVDTIERGRISGRDVHAGTLRTPAGDSIHFVALGSTRSVVARSAVRFCGMAHDKSVVGLFELPENSRIEQ